MRPFKVKLDLLVYVKTPISESSLSGLYDEYYNVIYDLELLWI